MLGLDFTRVDRIATDRAGMLWAGEGCRTASTRASRSATSRGACAPSAAMSLPVRKAPGRGAGPIASRR